MNEPGLPRPCSTPHSSPLARLRAWPGRAEGAAPTVPAEPADATQLVDAEGLRAAIEVVLAHPEALAEIIGRAPPSAFPLTARATRHDGWTGERMAAFLEILAATGLITEACRAVGMSRDSAYGLRSRDPVFAAAMRAALAKARPQLADTLLERSLTGTVEQHYRDGVLVGERRHYESWLALAVLKRLDKQAAEDRAEGALSARIAGDWQATLDALRDGGPECVPALLQAETDETDMPLHAPGVEPCWKAESDHQHHGLWLTDFPPPPGFDGYERGVWDGESYYERACTEEEVALLEARDAADRAEERAEAERRRTEWFARLDRKAAVAVN